MALNNKYIQYYLMSLNRGKLYKSSPQLLNQNYQTRQWLQKHGKNDRIIFSKEMVDKLSKYFYSLDEDGSNTISANQLQDPLILFGLCRNREEVDQIFKTIDIDQSGQLDFQEFLQVFRKVAAQKRSKRPCKKQSTDSTFQDFTKTLLGIHAKIEKGVSFRLGMSIYRRKNMLKAIMGTSLLEKQKGKEIMNKFEQQIIRQPSIRAKLHTVKEMNQQNLPRFAPKTAFANHRRLKTMM